MGSQAATAGAGIALIPWDPASDAHAERMTTQRHACGWDVDQVPYWQKKVAAGDKLLFWIVLSGRGDEEELLAKHRAGSAAEIAPLRDTAARVGRTDRTPTADEFLPIGHIALDEYPMRNVLFGLPAATLWIKSFYISKAIQSGGLGRKAMEQAEAMAAAAPFHSAALALDTTHQAWQRRMTSQSLYGTDEPPADAPSIRTNQAWYTRQDYADMALPDTEGECARAEGRESLGYYAWTNPETGEFFKIPTVYMYKMMRK
ncbi:hypothetical protein LMH87_011869 [Akanthomyces muscarius]|uniref:Acyl-CoA N-acyltransferase n=1 Tax=Akanthomyces muscarius TaxID=2231603 RepID=A0A9W8QA00_AKAMU|nr:hypothetical protein LMH87_011869 [Akanthomyces muscarius]KAJ4151154.1 hypothetical protein LMH87_011869 [Akanthomyces muscarius]